MGVCTVTWEGVRRQQRKPTCAQHSNKRTKDREGMEDVGETDSVTEPLSEGDVDIEGV